MQCASQSMSWLKYRGCAASTRAGSRWTMYSSMVSRQDEVTWERLMSWRHELFVKRRHCLMKTIFSSGEVIGFFVFFSNYFIILIFLNIYKKHFALNIF